MDKEKLTIKLPVRQAVAEDVLVTRSDGSEHLRYGQPYFLWGKNGLIDKTYSINSGDEIEDLIQKVSDQTLFVPSVKLDLVIARAKDLKLENKLRVGLVVYIINSHDDNFAQPYVLSETTNVHMLADILNQSKLYIEKQNTL